MAGEHEIPGMPDFADLEAAVAAGNSPAVFALFEQSRRKCGELREERDAARRELRRGETGPPSEGALPREEDFRAFVEHCPDGILRMDCEYRILYANSAAAALMGCSREELPGRQVSELPIPMYFSLMIQGGVKRAITRGGEEVFDYGYDYRERKYFLGFRISPEFAESGSVESVIVHVRDVSEQKLTEKAFRESGDRFEHALTTFPMMVFSQDLDLHYTWVYTALPECSSLEFIGSRDDELFLPEEAETLTELKRNVLKTGIPAVMEADLTFSSGRMRFSLSVAPFRNHDGEVIGIIGAALDINDRKQVGEALRAKEAELQMVADSTPILLTRISRNLKYVYVNHSFAEMFGRKREEIIGKPIVEIMGEKAVETIRPYYEKVLGGERVEYETEIIYRDIGPRFMYAVYIPERNEYGEVVGWFASIQDVTERKRSEEALRESEERYRSLAENVPCVLMRFDRQFRVVYLNPQPDQYNPNPVERMMGRTNREMGMPEHLCDLWDAAIERVFRTGSQEEMEFDFEMTSGMRTFALKFAPEFGPDHEVRYVLGVSSDITERRQTEMALQEAYERIQAQAEELEMQAEELRTTNVELEAQTAEIRCYNDELRATADALRESEEQYRTFFDLGTVGMTQADPKTGRLLRVNDRYCEITGYTREELLTATVYDLTWFEDREEDRAKIDRLMKGEIPWYRNEKRLIRRDGKIIWALVSAGMVRDAYGEPLRTVGVLLDITDRKDVEEGIVQLRREQEAFVRHEMKNLFAPLQLFAELLLQETENLSEQQIHYLQRIAESAGRVAGFIDAMRNIHALETGKYELRRSPYPLDIIIWQTIHDLESLTARNGVSVRFSAPEKEAMMMLDRNLLPGVFTNLILNAVEHVAKLPDPGEKVVTVDFREETHKYAVRINNRGEPVPPERLATFFEKYNPGPEKKHGTGLGTTYARLVTKAHGGEISVDSNAEEGTTVTVVLPGK